MRNIPFNRSNLSDEKLAYLSELSKRGDEKKNMQNNEDNTPDVYKRPEKEKEIDLLWQAFKINPKEERSPGVYLLTGFIAGGLCMFVMMSALNIHFNMPSQSGDDISLGQPKFEKQFSRKSKIPKINSISVIHVDEQAEEVENPQETANETYEVQSGDTISKISYRFYGKFDPEKIEKIKQMNGITSENRLKIGQKLIIPVD